MPNGAPEEIRTPDPQIRSSKISLRCTFQVYATVRRECKLPLILGHFSHIFALRRAQTSELPTSPKPFENRFIATAAGVSEFDAKLLMNHAIPGVNAGYVTRHKLLEDHLRSQQQAISGAVFAALGETLVRKTTVRNWLGRRASRRVQIEANACVTADEAFGRVAA